MDFSTNTRSYGKAVSAFYGDMGGWEKEIGKAKSSRLLRMPNC